MGVARVKPHVAWVRVSPDLQLSGDGRYAITAYAGSWICVHWDGIGWNFIANGPQDTLTEAKRVVASHRWTRDRSVTA